MADILIRGMEMPATCWNCKLKVGFSACGLVTDHKDGGFFYRVHEGKSRPDWCPLVPLPEGHGRLIDADALFEVMGQDTDRWLIDDISYIETDDAISAVYKAPTIVPAEGCSANV